MAPADGTGAHLALDCGGHARPFTLDLSNSTLVMQVPTRHSLQIGFRVRALDCGGHARAFTPDVSNSKLVMQVPSRHSFRIGSRVRALDCGGHARAFTLDLLNSTLVMQVPPGQGFASKLSCFSGTEGRVIMLDLFNSTLVMQVLPRHSCVLTLSCRAMISWNAGLFRKWGSRLSSMGAYLVLQRSGDALVRCQASMRAACKPPIALTWQLLISTNKGHGPLKIIPQQVHAGPDVQEGRDCSHCGMQYVESGACSLGCQCLNLCANCCECQSTPV